MSGEICSDNRFEIIAAYKKKLIESTNIQSSPEEMAVIDNILFRFWQMGWIPPVPHGRLIDADKIPYKKIMLDNDDEFYYGVTQPYIDRMPTIIPADDKDTDVPIKEDGET